jgi:hypothetical protein
VRDEIHEECFDKLGNPTLTDREKVYAKRRTINEHEAYLIATHEDVPFNPFGTSSSKEDYVDIRLKKTSRETFNFYMLFLKTNNSLYLTRAQRRFLND